MKMKQIEAFKGFNETRQNSGQNFKKKFTRKRPDFETQNNYLHHFRRPRVVVIQSSCKHVS